MGVNVSISDGAPEKGVAGKSEKTDKIMCEEAESLHTYFDDYGSDDDGMTVDDEDESVEEAEEEDLTEDDFSAYDDDGDLPSGCFDDYGSSEDSWTDEVNDSFERRPEKRKIFKSL